MVTWITSADLSNPTSPYAEAAAAYSSWILYKLSGEKYPGVSRSTDYYCADSMADLHPMIFGRLHTKHFNIYEVADATSSKLWLRSRPVNQVHRVSIPGHDLNEDEYFVGNKAFLMCSGGQRWDFSSGIVVDYSHGIAPPEAGMRAAVKLANELIYSIEDPAQCALPDRVTSVSRQGMSFEMLQPTDFIENGRTGVYEIDLFLQAANPIKARKRPKIFSPDFSIGIRRS